MEFDGTINIGTIITVIVLLGSSLWFIWSRIEKAKQAAILKAEAAAATAQLAREELAQYRTHVAETYATKIGLNESLTRVHDALDRLTDRIDALIAQGNSKPSRTTRRSSEG